MGRKRIGSARGLAAGASEPTQGTLLTLFAHPFQTHSAIFSPASGLPPSRPRIVNQRCSSQEIRARKREHSTMQDLADPLKRKRNVALAIAVGALVAGVVDLLQACIEDGWDIPLYVAAGLLGRQAIQGGAVTYILGVLLHFFIAFSAAAVYYAASRKLSFLTEHPLVCGLFFGAAVMLVMNLVVMPLSALQARGPFTLNYLLRGLVQKMVVVGLPISFSVRRFAR